MNLILILIIIASLGPIVGSLAGVLKKPSNVFMFNMLSFAAGVMLSISFLELVPESIQFSSIWICILGLTSGAVVMYILDRTIPHLHPSLNAQEQGCNLRRTATYVLLGIFMHNFPEGMAIAVGLTSDVKMSVIVALAIMIHDIPEGICTAAPYYYCTKKKLKSFLVSASTAIPTIMGILVFYYLSKYIPLWGVGFLIAATAGLMIYISADELIPTSCSKLTQHSTIFSLIGGVLLVLVLKTL
ncbi:hypothetical protein FJZ53_01455 [Candidatus Woesearchaeota archaeon]|nr:hypothetical protein [Candidatus Woesearchaeota archaeon]